MTDGPIRMDVDLSDFKKQLGKLAESIAEENLVTAAKAGGLIVQNAAKEKSPKRTRTLSRSIHMEVVESSRYKVEIAIGTDVAYAAIHEFGGVITPKQAKVLAFEIGGELIFAKRVTILARPYLRPAMDENVQAVADQINATLAQLLARANA